MALTILPRALRQAYQWGVPLSPDPRRGKRIYLSNRIAVIASFISLMYSCFYPLLGLARLSIVSVAIAFAYAFIPLLNRRGHTWISRILLVYLSSAAIVGMSLALGRVSGFELFLLPVAWMLLVLFDWEERATMVWGVGLNSIALLAINAFAPERGLFLALSDANVRILHFVVVAVAQFFQVVVVFYFFLANRQTETALAEAGESARAADKAKSQFLANMSHEIRTPLNGILGMSSLLLKSEMRDDQKDLVQAIQSSSLDLMVIIGEILDLSKIEAGKMKLENAPFSPEPLLDSVMRPFEHEARRKRLDLRLETAPGIPAMLIGDPIRLKQVLNNLIGNALKFTQQGGVTVRVRAAGPERPDDAGADGAPGAGQAFRLGCEVEDTGIGIPEEAREKIFQSFSQVDQAETRKYGGTGLGLFISKQIVDMMGGRIGFQTRRGLGSGSLFHFEIPFPIAPTPRAPAAAAAAETPAVAHVPEAKPSPAAPARLLIVEDHPLNQKVLSGFLAQAGHRADLASGGQEALKMFSIAPYDLVFMDCHMPGMDGFECTRALREMRFGGKRPVIIGVTADAMVGTREKCLQAGMDDVLTKPILAEELQNVLSRWLGTAKPRQAVAAPKTPHSNWVDLRHLREMDEWIRVYDPRFWERAQHQFRDSAARLIASIRAAFEAGNLGEAGESAHSLKGLCLMLGLSRMGEACKSLEVACAHGGAEWLLHFSDLEASLEPSLAEMRRQVGQT
ncbi:MAG TPA: ATP-binding protein [Fibrobacteria bacterium]|nr:ATP-binding protein [Fibrobacteria bacterium]